MTSTHTTTEQDRTDRRALPDTRYCMCHRLPVVWTHRRDESGMWQVTHLCSVDLFDLGFGGGIRLRDMREEGVV